MKHLSIKSLLALGVAILSLGASADATSTLCERRRAMGAAVKLGRWHADLEACKKYCQENGVPLVAVWSNGDQCGHCLKLTNNLLSDAFTNWMKNSGIVFYFGWNQDQYEANRVWGPACIWCCNGNTGKTLPFVRMWWPKKNVDHLTDGDTWDHNKGRWGGRNDIYRPEEMVEPGDYNTFNPGGRFCIDYLMNASTGILRKYKYTPAPKVTYYGGDFVAPTNRYTGLQAVIGETVRVTVPLSRTNETALAQNVCTNKYRVTYPEGHVTNSEIVWAKDQKAADLVVNAGMNRISDASRGKQLVIELLDSTNGVSRTSYITCVSSNDYPNASKNPYWIGERTADTLKWGEWTMDLDAVTSKVFSSNAYWRKNAVEKRAYAMYLVSGSCWCPDCAMAEKYLFERGEFKTWAANNRVALGVIDIPKSPTSAPAGAPSLLTYVSATASDAFVTCRGTCAADETQRVQSGAAYLSRHSIPQTGNDGKNATDVAARNAKLMKNVAPVGLNDPVRVAAGQERTGAPVVLFLRDDGKVAVRWSLLSDYGPEAWNENLLKRFDEMLKQVAVENDRLASGDRHHLEEANDYFQTTEETVSKRATKSGLTLSNFDVKDCYKIETAAIGQMVNFKVSGKDAVGASISVVQAIGNQSAVVKTADGGLATDEGVWTNELSVTCLVPTNSYLVVKAQTLEGKGSTPASAVLSATSQESTVCAYKIESSNVLVPTALPQEEYTEDPLITILTVANKSYRISNLKANDEGVVTNAVGETVFVAGATEGVFVAQETDAVRVTLAEPESEGAHKGEYGCVYQVWETGTIGFDRDRDVVRELDETNRYQIAVSRIGGVSGTARCAIYLSREKSSTIWDGTIFEWTKDGTILEWEPLDGETKFVSVDIVPNEFWDGDQTLVFDLLPVDKNNKPLASDAGFGTSEFTLTIRDNDTETPGKLAISGTWPLPSKDMTVLAGVGDRISLWVGRFYGADGPVSVSLGATGGSLSTNELVWASRTSGEQEVVLDLAGCAPGATVRVTLTPTGRAKVDADRMVLVVKVIDDNPPAFADTVSLDLDAYCYLPIAEKFLSVDGSTVSAFSNATVRLYSGRLAPGLSARYDAGTGRLVISGVPTTSGEYVAVYQVCDGERKGLTATVATKVYDATKGTRLNPPLNPSVSTARTFADLIVRDETTKKFSGLLTLTIPRTGRLSAKYRQIDGAVVSFASESWSDLDKDDQSQSYGSLTADLVAISDGAEDWSLKVVAAPEGDVELTLNDGVGTSYAFETPVFDWSSEKLASDWAGYYTVSIPQTNNVSAVVAGPGYAILNMPTNDVGALAAGQMKFAGLLPNGKSFSGVGTLVPVDWNETFQRCDAALLPVVIASDTDALSGIFSIKPDALKQVKTLRRSVSCRADVFFAWKHREAVDDLCADVQLDALGGIFDAAEDIALCCEQVFDGKQPYFYVLQGLMNPLYPFSLGIPASWDDPELADIYPLAPRAVHVWRKGEVNKIKMTDAAAALDTYGLTFAFDRMTGLVSGSVRLDFYAVDPAHLSNSKVATFRGVVMPGWGASCAACTLGNDEAKSRPFISGAVWFADTYNYTDGRGRARTLQTKRSCPFSVGLNPGE